MKLARSIFHLAPVFILGIWGVRIFQFTDHFFEKAYTDQFSLLLVFSLAVLVGHQIRHRLKVDNFLATLILFLLTLCLLPITDLLLTKSNYSTLPLYIAVLIAGGIIAGQSYRNSEFILGLTAGVIAAVTVNFSDIALIVVVVATLFVSQAKPFIKLSGIILAGASFILVPKSSTLFEAQKRYFDKVVMADSTRFQNTDITEWKRNLWFYSNGKIQFSSFDYYLYYEPFAHPAMHLAGSRAKILVIGNENGLLVKELLKYVDVASIDLLPIDREQVLVAKSQPLFSELNNQSLGNEKVEIIEKDVFDYLEANKDFYDLIFIDSPDPVDVETNQYFTVEFYHLVKESLHKDGLFITQSLSPYLSPESFQIIQEAIGEVSQDFTRLHNQVPTLGEWSWIIASPFSNKPLRDRLESLESLTVNTKWLNMESIELIISFGKDQNQEQRYPSNTLINPSLYKVFNRETSLL